MDDYSGPILEFAGTAIYTAMAAAALFGVWQIMVLRGRIKQKRFSNENHAQDFLEEVRVELEGGNFENVVELCDSPAYWSKAVPQLILLAIANKHRSPQKLKRLLAEKFERDILADLDYRTSWVATIVKTAPMLGLLGTVVGMILAFQTIAASSESGGGTNPAELADKIGIALFTTAIGLSIAIPLVLLGAQVNVRIGKLQDSVQQHLGEFLEDFEAIRTAASERGAT